MPPTPAVGGIAGFVHRSGSESFRGRGDSPKLRTSSHPEVSHAPCTRRRSRPRACPRGVHGRRPVPDVHHQLAAADRPDSTTPTSTTSDPADEPPVLPDAAKSQTTAGAKAFVRHYADVLNYAWLNLDPRRCTDASATAARSVMSRDAHVQSSRRQRRRLPTRRRVDSRSSIVIPGQPQVRSDRCLARPQSKAVWHSSQTSATDKPIEDQTLNVIDSIAVAVDPAGAWKI